jgi:hypothetical protein
MAKDPANRYAATGDLIEDLQAVANRQPPSRAHELIGLMVSTPADQVRDSEDEAEPFDTPHQESLFRTPLFWIAVTGWALVVILAVVVVLLVT